MEMFTKRQEICLLFINESKEKDEDIVKFIITDWHDFHLSNKKSCISNIFIYCFFFIFSKIISESPFNSYLSKIFM